MITEIFRSAVKVETVKLIGGVLLFDSHENKLVLYMLHVCPLNGMMAFTTIMAIWTPGRSPYDHLYTFFYWSAPPPPDEATSTTF